MKPSPRAQGRLLRGAVLLIALLGLIGPIGAGLLSTGLAAFGWAPAIGARAVSAAAFEKLMAEPGFTGALWLTVSTGAGATALSLFLAAGLCAALYGRMSRRAASRMLAPFLAAPHAAMAIGLVFLLSPSGWIARALAPLLSWERAPDFISVNDPAGLALITGLVVKETPFLLLVMLTALTQIPAARQIAEARMLGYNRSAAWALVIFPQIWPLIRLPVFVVLAYSLSVADMAIILGPSNPPTLAVMLTRLFTSPDITMLPVASAGAIVQAALVLAGFAALWLAGRAAAGAGRMLIRRGRRGRAGALLFHIAAGALALLLAAGALAMISLLIWSFAWRWPFPELTPESWSLRAWMMAEWAGPFFRSLGIAAASAALSLALAIAWLEGESAWGRRARWAGALIYAPLLAPQISFLYGLNTLFLQAGVSGGAGAVIWAHALFVFPYVMIALSDPWRALDPKLIQAASSLGAGPWRRLFRVRLPVLLAPVLTAGAIGLAVSVAQYLPTLFMGAGRVSTLTTEAVTLSSGRTGA